MINPSEHFLLDDDDDESLVSLLALDVSCWMDEASMQQHCHDSIKPTSTNQQFLLDARPHLLLLSSGRSFTDIKPIFDDQSSF